MGIRQRNLPRTAYSPPYPTLGPIFLSRHSLDRQRPYPTLRISGRLHRILRAQLYLQPSCLRPGADRAHASILVAWRYVKLFLAGRVLALPESTLTSRILLVWRDAGEFRRPVRIARHEMRAIIPVQR
jgi:hypothetical protein